MPLLLVIASGNPHKIHEINQILGTRTAVVGMRQLGPVPNLAETGSSFEANAAMKVIQLRQWLNDNANLQRQTAAHSQTCLLAEDSGLEVDALNGAPGVRSARFASSKTSDGNASDEQNNAKLLSLLQTVPNQKRTARFRCVLALLPHPAANKTQIRFFTGTCEGQITKNPQGQNGFGYDPLFLPAGYNQSFGKLSPKIKNRISHRARALAKLAAHLSLPQTK